MPPPCIRIGSQSSEMLKKETKPRQHRVRLIWEQEDSDRSRVWNIRKKWAAVLPLGWKMCHFNLIIQNSGTSLVPGSDHKWPVDHFNAFYLFIMLGNIVILWVSHYSGTFVVVSTLDSCSHVKLNSSRKGLFAHTTFDPPNFFLSTDVDFFLVYQGFGFVYVLIISLLNL